MWNRVRVVIASLLTMNRDNVSRHIALVEARQCQIGLRKSITMKTTAISLLGLLFMASSAIAGQSSATIAVSCRVVPSIPQSVAYYPSPETVYSLPVNSSATYTTIRAAEQAALSKNPDGGVVYVRVQINY
jgi:exosortase/archaeosortase